MKYHKYITCNILNYAAYTIFYNVTITLYTTFHDIINTFYIILYIYVDVCGLSLSEHFEVQMSRSIRLLSNI